MLRLGVGVREKGTGVWIKGPKSEKKRVTDAKNSYFKIIKTESISKCQVTLMGDTAVFTNTSS